MATLPPQACRAVTQPIAPPRHLPFSFVSVLVSLLVLTIPFPVTAKAPSVEAGYRLFQLGEHEEAVELYEDLIQDAGVTAAPFKAWFYLGRSYQELGRYQTAAAAFRHAGRARGGSREAAWQRVAECFYYLGDYVAGLEMLESLARPRGFCGTCRALQQSRRSWNAAVLNDHLERYDEAIGHYLLVESDSEKAHLRILELYDGADQMEDLRRFLDEEDQRWKAITEKYRANQSGYQPPMQSAIARTIRPLLKLHDLKQREDWNALLNYLDRRSTEGSECSPAQWKEAARILATRAEQTMPPLLSVARESLDSGIYERAAYAFGLLGSEDSIALLKRLASQAPTPIKLAPVLDALFLDGEEGRTVLRSLEQDYPDGLQGFYNQQRRRQLFDGQHMVLPSPRHRPTQDMPSRCRPLDPQKRGYLCER